LLQKVDLDIERRKEAVIVDAKGGKDRPLQVAFLTALSLPFVWAYMTMESPTMSEQLSGWLEASIAQLLDGRVTVHFQLAVVALSIERMCYTWCHTFAPNFMRFTKTDIGRMMGDTPVNVVLTIFYINKCIQLGTFLGFYFYVVGFPNPIEYACKFDYSAVTRLQWVFLVLAAGLGQGLNVAIYRAIGKAGVYYGYRLGEQVPWVTGFPFSVLPHPQYFGACVTVIGVNAFVATPTHVAAGFLNLTIVQVLFYTFMAFVEDYL